MKLIYKTIAYYLLISIPLLILAGLFAYSQIKADLREETHETLVQQAFHAEGLAISFDKPQNMYLDFNRFSSIKISSPQKNSYYFKDTVMYSTFEKELLPYRMMRNYFTVNNQTYLITVVKTTEEEDELVEGLFFSFILILVFLLLAFFIVNWWISKKLWKPFYKTLEKLNDYDIKNHSPENFDKTDIKEFSQLNQGLNKMTQKIHSDFIQQKEFTENASHEMQTPLAVIKANVSLLMQSQNIKDDEMGQIQAIDDTAKKLTALNKALLLLSKIENNQFKEVMPVDLKDVARKVLLHAEDLTDAKQLAVKDQMIDSLIINMNPVLAEILVTNLFQNAIRHNFTGGKITLSIVNNEFIISNTGEPLTITEDELFMRFKKNEASTDSHGLGLAIVKSICSLYAIDVSYSYHHQEHHFILKSK